MAKKRAHVANNSGNNEWYTPPEIIEPVRALFGGFDLDPASSEKANETVRARNYFTAQDNGLLYPWHGRVWLNPPYGRGLISAFVEKFLAEWHIGHISEAAVLVNNATETEWFQNLAGPCSDACFFYGRIKFLSAGVQQGSPLQGQVLLYFGNRPGAFRAATSELGWHARNPESPPESRMVCSEGVQYALNFSHPAGRACFENTESDK